MTKLTATTNKNSSSNLHPFKRNPPRKKKSSAIGAMSKRKHLADISEGLLLVLLEDLKITLRSSKSSRFLSELRFKNFLKFCRVTQRSVFSLCDQKVAPIREGAPSNNHIAQGTFFRLQINRRSEERDLMSIFVHVM